MPAPSNDDFANATALSTTLPGSLTGQTNIDATKESGEPSTEVWETTSQSVWYTFTPTATGRYVFRIQNAVDGWSDVRTGRISVYTGSAVNALTLVRTDVAPPTSQDDGNLHDGAGVFCDLTSGVTYRIRVSSPFDSSFPSDTYTINFDLAWDEVTATAPANDDIANIEDLGSDPPDGDYPGTTVGATVEGWESTAGYRDPTAWFRFHSTVTGTQELHVVRAGDPDYRPYFEVYEITTDPPADLTDLSFVDDSDIPAPNTDSSDAVLMLSVVAGKDYAIVVEPSEYNSGHQDDFTLWFGEPTPPPTAPGNDDRADVAVLGPYDLAKSDWGAEEAYPWANEYAGTTVLATAEVGDPTIAGFAATRNVWHRVSFNTTQDGETCRVWVESAVDCVLGVYEIELGTGIGTFIAADDDSGTGNWPELTFTIDDTKSYWLIVDSKTEGTYTLKYQVLTGTPKPDNDDFANAEVITSLPFSMAGSTVNGSAETAESDSEALGTGPTDSVWYRYTPSGNAQVKITATCDTNGEDGYVVIDVWKGTSLATLERLPPSQDSRGFFVYGHTPTQTEARALVYEFEAGVQYNIRVQTFHGGSEDFTIYVDTGAIYINIEASGSEEMHGTLLDDAEIYVNIQHSGSEEFHLSQMEDSGTVLVDIQPGGSELQAHDYTDAATVNVDIQFLGGECYSTFSGVMLASDAEWRWQATANWRWRSTAEWRWSAGEIQIEGVNC